jgi:hypothetical protein
MNKIKFVLVFIFCFLIFPPQTSYAESTVIQSSFKNKVVIFYLKDLGASAPFVMHNIAIKSSNDREYYEGIISDTGPRQWARNQPVVIFSDQVISYIIFNSLDAYKKAASL